MSSKIVVQRVCCHCGCKFTARTTRTKYCSHKCANRAYKSRKRDKKIAISNIETLKVMSLDIEVLKYQDYLSIPEAAKLYRISRSTIYRMAECGKISIGKIGRRSILRRAELDDKLFTDKT